MDKKSAVLSKELLLTIIENLQESIFVTDGKGKILLVNSVAVELLGISAEEMVGGYVADMLSQGKWKNSSVLEAIQKRETAIKLIECKDGSKNISTSIPIFDRDGTIQLVITNSSGEKNLKRLYEIMEKEKSNADRYRRELEYLRASKENKIVAKSEAMLLALKNARAAAKTDNTVILTGETGVGKDVVANYIHMQSHRGGHVFVDINCAAIPDNLFEAELFGYEKGAFSGASNEGKMGLFEVARGGTVFLDEIAELPLSFQAKLLRVLESKEFRKIGGTQNIATDVRIICATNRDLKQMADENLFRQDLYYRLNEFTISIDPLRRRQEDIVPLAQVFLNELNEKYGTGKVFSAQMLENLIRYQWPGNIRELRNVISRAYILAEGTQLDAHLFRGADEAVLSEGKIDTAVDICLQQGSTLKEFRIQMEEIYIQSVLESCGQNVAEAADFLGVHRSHLYRKLNEQVKEEFVSK